MWSWNCAHKSWQLTKAQPSPKKFDKAGLVSREAPVAVEMNDLCSLTANQQMTVTVKVKTADEPEKVKNIAKGRS